MKRMFLNLAAIVLSVVMALALFTACGGDKTETTAATEKTAIVTVEVDGQQITIENPENKSIQELLTQAGITLGSEDVVSVDPTRTSGDNMFVQVLRKNTVTVVVTDEDAQEVSYTVSCMGGTVADAIAEAGVEIPENYTVQYDLEQALENGMRIVISPKEEDGTEPTTPETTEGETAPTTEPTTPPTTEPKPTTPKPTTPKPTTPKPTEPKPTTPKPTTPKPTEPTTAPTTAPTTPPTTAPTEPAKTVVNVEYYYDCDGSGHGVKVITYSDGTQEEVEF